MTAVQSYAGSLALVAVSTLLGLWIAPRWGTSPVDMIYLPAVLAAAALWGLGPALVAGVAAALAYNFFFTAPVHTFRMDRVADVVTVVVLLIVALVTSRLAAGIRAPGPARRCARRPQRDHRGICRKVALLQRRGGDRPHRLRRAAPAVRLQCAARQRSCPSRASSRPSPKVIA